MTYMKKAIVEIDQGLWRISDYYLSNYYLIEGKDYAVVIDSGIGLGDIQYEIKTITDKPVYLILTHGHIDHIGGAFAFDTVYLHPRDELLARTYYADRKIKERYVETRVPLRFPGEGHAEILKQLLPEKERCETFFNYEALSDGQTFDLGGRTIEILTCPGHTEGSVAVLDRQSGALFTGDTVNVGVIIMNDEENQRNIQTFHDSLEKLWSYQEEYEYLLVGHEEPETRYEVKLRKALIREYLELSEQVISGMRGEYEACGIRKGEVLRKGNVAFWYRCDA